MGRGMAERERARIQALVFDQQSEGLSPVCFFFERGGEGSGFLQ